MSKNGIEQIKIEKALTDNVHGTLVSVDGLGTLIIGKSGVGKSEAALELIRSGNQLVSDDLVKIMRIGDMLIGSSPEISKQYIEIRGLGIVNIFELYGISAFVDKSTIDIVICLEKWDENIEYDRLGIKEEKIDYLGVLIPKVTIPVSAGRNLAILIEAAVSNEKLKRMGYNSSKAFLNKCEDKKEKL